MVGLRVVRGCRLFCSCPLVDLVCVWSCLRLPSASVSLFSLHVLSSFISAPSSLSRSVRPSVLHRMFGVFWNTPATIFATTNEFINVSDLRFCSQMDRLKACSHNIGRVSQLTS